jgi:aryl sulfotransferase
MAAPSVHYRNFLADNARWDGIELRAGDIVISTPPKCGTTWMQVICGLLIFQNREFPGGMDDVSPWVEFLTRKHETIVELAKSQQHRRFFKSHTPLDGLPYDERVIYICVARDPRDAAISWGHFMGNVDMEAVLARRTVAVGPLDPAEMPENDPSVQPESPRERFLAWVANPATYEGMSGLFHHLRTFWERRAEPNIVLIHFDDLKADLEGQMRGLADRLGISVDEKRWPELVRAATFDEMRSRAEEVVPEPGTWRDVTRFFHRGTSGQWRDVLTDDDLRLYEARVHELCDPDLAAWVHRGPITG